MVPAPGCTLLTGFAPPGDAVRHTRGARLGPKRTTLPDTGACERNSGRPFRVDQYPPGRDRIEPMAATFGLSSLHPMPLVRIPVRFDHEQFVFELKYDG